MPNNNITREQPFGAIEKRVPSREFKLHAKDLTSSEQAVPIRVAFGTFKCGGTYFTPIWGFRSVPIKQKVGK